jgi:hypothetical protein
MATLKGIRLRMYQVGFGDCFLLTFHYSRIRRHVLIDFGSTRLPKGVTLERVAESIAEECGDDPVAIVATHRHKDHISGFGSDAAWPFLAELDIAGVVQPWTEQPDLAAGATAPDGFDELDGREPDDRFHVHALARMQARAGEVLNLVPSLSSLPAAARREIEFIADDNLSNAEAVKNLASFGERCRYVKFGDKGVFEDHLPGIKVHVLGPPTLDQSSSIRRQVSRHDEYWHLYAALPTRERGTAASAGAPPLRRRLDAAPLHADWLRYRLDNADTERLLSIVRALDKAMNNTSVILLFQVGEARLLFPGDAQIESWAYALSEPGVREMLKDVTVYKVGHHGSLNATPRSIWRAFSRLGAKDDPGRLVACLSTLEGVHGSVSKGTEVPRERLLRELSRKSTLHSTAGLKRNELYVDIDIPF